MRACVPRRAVTSPRRCPLEPEDRSLRNFDLPSSEGTISSATPPSTESRRWIRAQVRDSRKLLQGDALPGESFDGLEHALFPWFREGDGRALTPGPAHPA